MVGVRGERRDQKRSPVRLQDPGVAIVQGTVPGAHHLHPSESADVKTARHWSVGRPWASRGRGEDAGLVTNVSRTLPRGALRPSAEEPRIPATVAPAVHMASRRLSFQIAISSISAQSEQRRRANPWRSPIPVLRHPRRKGRATFACSKRCLVARLHQKPRYASSAGNGDTMLVSIFTARPTDGQVGRALVMSRRVLRSCTIGLGMKRSRHRRLALSLFLTDVQWRRAYARCLEIAAAALAPNGVVFQVWSTRPCLSSTPCFFLSCPTPGSTGIGQNGSGPLSAICPPPFMVALFGVYSLVESRLPRGGISWTITIISTK